MIALIHSPLVGPFSWSLVARVLRARGMEVVVPCLKDAEEEGQPYWAQHARSVAQDLKRIAGEGALHLVAHSGAGPLLPAIRQALPQCILSYLFVDAGLPRDGASRLDLMAEEDPVWAAGFRAHLTVGGAFPTWGEEDLRAVIPSASVRQALLAELQPRRLPFFEEPLPVFAGWPDAPCGYLQFSAAYDEPARQAERQGWPVTRWPAGHFHMLVDPEQVAKQLLRLLAAGTG